jgi:hypothetical protein
MRGCRCAKEVAPPESMNPSLTTDPTSEGLTDPLDGEGGMAVVGATGKAIGDATNATGGGLADTLDGEEGTGVVGATGKATGDATNATGGGLADTLDGEGTGVVGATGKATGDATNATGGGLADTLDGEEGTDVVAATDKGKEAMGDGGCSVLGVAWTPEAGKASIRQRERSMSIGPKKAKKMAYIH